MAGLPTEAERPTGALHLRVRTRAIFIGRKKPAISFAASSIDIDHASVLIDQGSFCIGSFFVVTGWSSAAAFDVGFGDFG
jgi:hypothetical protein